MHYKYMHMAPSESREFIMEGKTTPFLPLISFLFLALSFDNGSLLLAEGETSSYIVHMDKPMIPKPFPSPHRWYASILNSIKTNPSSSNTHLYTYNTVVHGFCAILSEQELHTLKKSPAFLSAYKDLPTQFHTTHTPDFLSLNPVTGIWPASKFGENVIVGVIDSGIWPENPSFSDAGMTMDIPAKWKGKCDEGERFNSTSCNLKLIGARFFMRELKGKNPIIGEINSTRDDIGHGTHTSSIIAGNFVEGASFSGYATGTARGVAPRARLAMYKVGSFSSDFLAAMDQAVADGVDIISVSAGITSYPPIYEDPIAIASFGAMEKGVLVSCSGGNDGPNLGTSSNGFPWAMTVGASVTDRWFGGLLTLGNGDSIVGWSIFPQTKDVTELPLIYNKTIASCNSSDLLSSAGNAVVICDGPDLFSDFERHAQIDNSTVPAVIFFTDSSSIFSSLYFDFPGVGISKRFQQSIMNYAVNGSKPTATIRFQQTLLGTKAAPTVADFSSRGPEPHIPTILKPDLIAPGSSVLAAWIPAQTLLDFGQEYFFSNINYFIMSGTSMSCPHASGIAALLKGAHQHWSPAAIRSAMMTTADALDSTGAAIKDSGFNYTEASPLAMGAGHVNPNKALDPGLVYDASPQDYINFLCSTSMNLTHAQISSITRSTKTDCSCPSTDLNYPSFIALYENSTRFVATTFRRTVTNVGDGAAVYVAKVDVPVPNGSAINVDVYPATLKFQKTGEKQSYTLGIRYHVDSNVRVAFGSLTWVEVGGNHTVRSPIVISPAFTT